MTTMQTNFNQAEQRQAVNAGVVHTNAVRWFAGQDANVFTKPAGTRTDENPAGTMPLEDLDC